MASALAPTHPRPGAARVSHRAIRRRPRRCRGRRRAPGVAGGGRARRKAHERLAQHPASVKASRGWDASGVEAPFDNQCAGAVPRARRWEIAVAHRLAAWQARHPHAGDGVRALHGVRVRETDTSKIRCSAILRAIPQRQACLAGRQLIQSKCFGGKPDAGHKTQIDDVESGIRQCEGLKLINCAKGHPMAGL